MSIQKKLHPRNRHNTGYDFDQLVQSYPALQSHVFNNEYGNLSVDFANPESIKLLNAAILKHDYKIENWHIPEGALCPPIPGRADYIHYVADLLNSTRANSKIKLLDIGTGANGIYPLLSQKIYNWQCVGSDISANSIKHVAAILKSNAISQKQIELRLQADKHKIFSGIIQGNEYFDITVCNPPFHASEKDAIQSSVQKSQNLSTPSLNFGGQANELWCNGGEKLFLKKMIKESKEFSKQVLWFSSLVSKVDNLKPSIKLIKKLGAIEVKEIEMIQGKKITRILAWRFH